MGMIAMRHFARVFLLFSPLFPAAASGQAVDTLARDTAGTAHGKTVHVAYFKLDDGDSVPVVNLPLVEIMDRVNPLVVDNMKRYLKLKRDVIRAYPYAQLAAETLRHINDTLSTIHRKKLRKNYIKRSETEMKARFERELKKLTVNQGKILIKLVNRETGDTSYEIVKELKGPINAMFWQTMARFFGSTMKAEYDPLGEDRLIEDIVQSIERGEIPVTKR